MYSQQPALASLWLHEGYAVYSFIQLLCRYLLEKAAVAVVPGSAFGAPNCIRISYAASELTLEAALDRMSLAFAKIRPASE